jgi:2-polyprenyl-3-methyl-5-hydroxy-6-metoxy-1,4-benzoquinol methylase
VKGPRTPEARQALALYADAPRGDRFHVRTRWWTCPFPAVEQAVPRQGRVLEVGCGHGLLSVYLGLCSSERDVLGVDIDEDKIVLARRAAEHLDPATARVRFEHLEPEGFAAGAFDAIVIADVLYLLPAERRLALLDECVAHLAPEGVLVVKEADRVPRWKGALTVGQELLATKVLRITEGDEVEFSPPSTFVDHLTVAGLDVDLRRIDRGYPHAHVLLTAHHPSA